MTVNLSFIKSKIIDYIKEKGPSLPANLTKITGMSLTFTSAILSELLSERKIKISNLKIGSSPLYYLEGQEEKLENFIDSFKPIEKDAFLKLKNNRILEDSKQEPTIRVALRSLKDFAIPIKVGEKLFWKYHLLSDEKALEAIEVEKKDVAIGEERVIGQNIWNDIKKEFSKEEVEEIIKKRINEIVEKLKEEKLIQNTEKLEEKMEEKKKLKKVKKENLFTQNLKKIMEEKNLALETILKEKKDKIIGICKKENKKFLFLIYAKKSVDEKEIFKDYIKYFQDYEGFFIFVSENKKEKLNQKKLFFDKLKDIFLLQ